ncbi:MAG: hypothetical protein L0170_09095, partial [Acidobacteria bacterium]|nr:hypothetical protein [Acidobacteriota bacterium]
MITVIALASAGLMVLAAAMPLLRRRMRMRGMEPENSGPGRVIPPGTPVRKWLHTPAPDLEDPVPKPPEPLPSQFRGFNLKLPVNDPKDNLRHLLGTPLGGLFTSYDSERALLGAMILDPGRISAVLAVVNSGEMLSIPIHRLIFDAILCLHLDRRQVNFTSLQEMVDGISLVQIASSRFLNSLVEDVPTAANACEYARVVREKFLLRTFSLGQNTQHNSIRRIRDL